MNDHSENQHQDSPEISAVRVALNNLIQLAQTKTQGEEGVTDTIYALGNIIIHMMREVSAIRKTMERIADTQAVTAAAAYRTAESNNE